MKGLKFFIVILCIVIIAMGGYLFYILSQNNHNNLKILEYEQKTKTLEENNLKIKNELEDYQKIVNNNSNSNSNDNFNKYVGKYHYGTYEKEKDCSKILSKEEAIYMELELNTDGTATFKEYNLCGSGYSGRGRYFIDVNGNVFLYNDECMKMIEESQEMQNCSVALEYTFQNGILYHRLFGRDDYPLLGLIKE